MGTLSQAVNVILNGKDKASPAVGKLAGSLDKLSKKVEHHRNALKRMSQAGAIMVGAMVAATLGAREQIKTQAVLAQTIENTGEKADQWSDKAEALMSSLQALTGVSDELQRETLSKLVIQTGSVEQAMQALPVVLDAASASGKDVKTVAETMGKALAGTVHQAESVGIVFDKNADFSERLATVYAKVGGAAGEAADPFKRMGAVLADVSDAIGVTLMPAFNAVADAVAGWAQALIDADPWVHTAIASVAGLVVVLAGTSGLLLILPQLSAAVTAFGVAVQIATGPIGLLAAGAALLVYALWDTEEAAVAVASPIGIVADKLKTDLPTGANAAVDALESTQDALWDTHEVFSVFTSATGELRAVFQARFGEISEDVAAALDAVDVTMGEKSGVFQETFSNATMSMLGEALRVLGPELGDGVAASFDVIHSGWNKGPGAAFESGITELDLSLEGLASSTIAHATAMQDAFTSVGEGMSLPLRDAVNQMSVILTGGYNEVYLPYVNNILATMHALDQNGLLGTQVGVLDSLPQAFPPMPALPTFRKGTLSQPGGNALVNESYGEIVTLPSGAGVRDAGSSTRLIESMRQTASTQTDRSFNNYGELIVVSDDPASFLDALEDTL